MEPDALVAAHPRVFHMAEVEALASIECHGLLSVSAILDHCGIAGDDRVAIEADRRPESVILTGADGSRFVIRDQKPLSLVKLQACLDGMPVHDWLRLLNRHVFFWPSRERCRQLLAARAYRGRHHLVIEVPTERLLERHGEAVRLTPINTGAVLYNPARRGAATFATIEDYPYEERRRVRGRREAIAEVAVEHAVPEVMTVASGVFVADATGWDRIR